MSLRAFHVLFIALSALLGVFFAGWAGTAYRANQEPGYAVAAVLALATAGGLVSYGAAFLRKTRGLS